MELSPYWLVKGHKPEENYIDLLKIWIK